MKWTLTSLAAQYSCYTCSRIVGIIQLNLRALALTVEVDDRSLPLLLCCTMYKIDWLNTYNALCLIIFSCWWLCHHQHHNRSAYALWGKAISLPTISWVNQHDNALKKAVCLSHWPLYWPMLAVGREWRIGRHRLPTLFTHNFSHYHTASHTSSHQVPSSRICLSC